MLDKVMTPKDRPITARPCYMASHRADLQFSVKELCRDKSATTDVSLHKLKRVGRYLKAMPTLKVRFDCQAATRSTSTNSPTATGCLSSHPQVHNQWMCNEREACDQNVEQHTGHHCLFDWRCRVLRNHQGRRHGSRHPIFVQ